MAFANDYANQNTNKMSSDLISQLPTLQDDSGVRISRSVVIGARGMDSQRLIRPGSGRGEYVPASGASGILSNLQYTQKLLTLSSTQEGFMRGMNHELKGGDSYPVLTFALGTAVGFVSGGAGLVFSLATLGLDLSRRSSNVMARKGDEIWCIEAIGKYYENRMIRQDRYVAQHVMSYFIVDPYRSNGNNVEKGWLIHETRTDLTVE